jgi:hypothetical protein
MLLGVEVSGLVIAMTTPMLFAQAARIAESEIYRRSGHKDLKQKV